MTGVEIAILIVSIVVGIYLLLLGMDIIFILSFSSIFRKHNTALGVMLHTKYDNIMKMIELFKKEGVKVPEEYEEMLSSIDANSFKDQELPECISARNDLAYLRNELVYIASTQPKINKNLEVKRAKDAITEMDANYRSLVAMYNADVLGYNYWINFWAGRYIKFIFKLKDKQII